MSVTRKVSWLLLMLASLTLAAKADIIYNNFGPGDTYDMCCAWVVAADSYIANPFTPGNSYTLDSITLAMAVSGASNFTVDLRTDADGIPGEIIESWSFLDVFTQTPSVHSMDSVLHPTLDAGSLYWFEVRATDPTTLGDWMWSLADVGPLVYSRDGGTTWSSLTGRRGLFRVEGTPTTPVPENLAR